MSSRLPTDDLVAVLEEPTKYGIINQLRNEPRRRIPQAPLDIPNESSMTSIQSSPKARQVSHYGLIPPKLVTHAYTGRTSIVPADSSLPSVIIATSVPAVKPTPFPYDKVRPRRPLRKIVTDLRSGGTTTSPSKRRQCPPDVITGSIVAVVDTPIASAQLAWDRHDPSDDACTLGVVAEARWQQTGKWWYPRALMAPACAPTRLGIGGTMVQVEGELSRPTCFWCLKLRLSAQFPRLCRDGEVGWNMDMRCSCFQESHKRDTLPRRYSGTSTWSIASGWSCRSW
jgi:hypothetical protein